MTARYGSYGRYLDRGLVRLWPALPLPTPEEHPPEEEVGELRRQGTGVRYRQRQQTTQRSQPLAVLRIVSVGHGIQPHHLNQREAFAQRMQRLGTADEGGGGGGGRMAGYQ